MQRDERIRELQRQLNDIARQLAALQRLDVNPPTSWAAPMTTTAMQLSSSVFTDAARSEVAPAVSGRAEVLHTWKVSDSDDFFLLSNSSTTNGRLSPYFMFRNVSAFPETLGVIYETLPANDTGADPCIVIAAYTRTSAQAFAAMATRPLIHFRNLATTHGVLLANGKWGFGVTAVGATRMGVQAGTSTNDAAVGGVLYVTTAQVGNVGTGEDDLASYSVPANTLAVNGQSLWFEAWGTITNNANAKTLRLRFGSTVLGSWTFSTGQADQWYVRGRVTRTGAATQKGVNAVIARFSSQPATVLSSPAETLSGAVTLKVTGEATANNDVVIEAFVVGYDDNNT